MKRALLSALALASAAALTAEVPLSLTWQLETTNMRNRDFTYTFTLKNISDTTVGDDWVVAYNSLTAKPTAMEKGYNVKIERIAQGYYKMVPQKGFRLAPGDSIRYEWHARGVVNGPSYAPDGGHFISSDGKTQPLAIACRMPYGSFAVTPAYPTGEKRFEINQAVNPEDAVVLIEAYDIMPSLKKVNPPANEEVDLSAAMIVYTYGDLDREAEYATRHLATTDSKSTINVELRLMSDEQKKDTPEASNYEYYELTLGHDCISIVGASADGVLNGVKTLVALVKKHRDYPIIKGATICDWPDLHHRGIMIDVARNFSKIGDIERLIEKLAEFKINRLHFHLADDEGWRIEIPGLPELTEVGGRRGYTEKESDFMFQTYAGNGDPDDLTTTANGYITRKDFIRFLRQAYAAGIEVAPEIESPGHARAAIVSMKARYEKYKDTDRAKADEYRVCDLLDTTKYTSVQGYNDNVLNPGEEGTFRFIDKVADELIAMYREADVPLPYIHVGGDEVARNPWDESPSVKRLMAEKNLKNTRAVEDYFIARVADMLGRKGYRIGGWQEAAMNHTDSLDEQLRPHFAAVNCWNTVPEWNGDTVSYTVANNGYPVVLCNVSNFYIDMRYNAHEGEPGLNWGGFVDEFRSWDARPFDIYHSVNTRVDGSPLDLTKQEGKTPLNPEARGNIIGVQAQLFSETIRNFSMVEYHVFPKAFGLMERGWNAEPGQQTKEFYNALIGEILLPALAEEGFNFHIPMPGIVERDGKIHMNKQYKAGKIRYTVDGSEPSENSLLYTGPFQTDSKLIKARYFLLGKSSQSTRLDR